MSDTARAVAGAILAGGASRRMGADKAYVVYDGAPMLARVSSALRSAGIADLVAVGGDAVRAMSLGIATIEDRWPGEGPLGGLLTAFDWFWHPLVCVVGCDLPELTGAVVASLVDALGDHDVAVARTDRPEPLCAVWRVETCRAVLAAAFESGQRAVHRSWSELDRVDVEVDGVELWNVNTPDDVR